MTRRVRIVLIAGCVVLSALHAGDARAALVPRASVTGAGAPERAAVTERESATSQTLAPAGETCPSAGAR